jgi:MoaA/NifB/PqqE/SkfB family radical SAM enzyme
MESIYLTICPTYNCNLNCNFCYLTNLDKKQLLDLNKLNNQLNEISKFYYINEIDVYGGEITILPNRYINELFDICFKYVKEVNIVTNLTKIIPIFYNNRTVINVGWDYIYKNNN